MRNYIIYYIAALAESKVAFIQNSLKIRSPNSSVGTNPSSVKLLGAILLSRTCVPKFISTICTGHSHPYEHCFVEIGCKWDIVKGTYKAGVSYAIAYQVNSNSLSSFNTIPTHIPLHSLFRARFRSWDRHTTISIPSPYHTIAQSTGQLPLGTVSRPVAPGYDRHSLTGEEEKDSSHYLV